MDSQVSSVKPGQQKIAKDAANVQMWNRRIHPSIDAEEMRLSCGLNQIPTCFTKRGFFRKRNQADGISMFKG